MWPIANNMQNTTTQCTDILDQQEIRGNNYMRSTTIVLATVLVSSAKAAADRMLV